MAFLDPQDFSLGTEPDMQSFRDRMLELRRGLPPAIAEQQPRLPGQPVMTSPERQQQDIAQSINDAARGQPVQPSQQPSPVGDFVRQAQQAIGPKMVQQVLKEAQNLDPPKLIGPDVFGRGGIMGTGLEPIDVLAFAIGAAVTSRLPQNQAIERTFQIASLPSVYKQNQRKAAQDFVQNATGVFNAQTQASNAEVAAANAGRATQQYQSGLALADAFRRAGRPADALALEADKVAEYVRLTGGAPDKLPPNLQFALTGIATGAIQDIPQWFVNMTGAKSVQEAQAIADSWLSGYLATQPVVPNPTGGAVGRSTQGPTIIQQGQAAPVSPGISGIRQQLNAVRSGQPVQQPAAVPQQPAAPQALQVPAQRPDARLDVRQQPPADPIQQLSQSPNKQDQWIASHVGDMPAQTEARLAPLFQRPLGEDTRQRLVAQRATLDYGTDLAQAYEDMVRSYGGDKKFEKSGAQLGLYLRSLGSRLSGEGIAGSAIALGTDAARKFAQVYGAKLTPEATRFVGLYQQAQKFAKGAMNDAANLAVRERTYFNQMIGTPLDSPNEFRSSVNEFVRNVAQEHNRLLQANQLLDLRGWEPVDVRKLPSGRPQPQPRGGAIQTPGGQLPPGWEAIQPPTIGGEY